MSELWLSGALKDVHPFIAPVLYSFQQAQEDLAAFSEGLTTEQVWQRHGNLAPLGFQLRHIAGSVERLTTYLEGKQLSDAQIQALKAEMTPGESLPELLAGIGKSFQAAEAVYRALDPARLEEPRGIGRKQLPTTVIGLLVHIAEHTQRHVGQAIVTAKLVRSQGGGAPA
jgi:hypothetical protein